MNKYFYIALGFFSLTSFAFTESAYSKIIPLQDEHREEILREEDVILHITPPPRIIRLNPPLGQPLFGDEEEYDEEAPIEIPAPRERQVPEILQRLADAREESLSLGEEFRRLNLRGDVSREEIGRFAMRIIGLNEMVQQTLELLRRFFPANIEYIRPLEAIAAQCSEMQQVLSAE